MWPFICQFIEKLFRETIEPAVRGAHPHLSTFSFTRVDVGQQVCFFSGPLACVELKNFLEKVFPGRQAVWVQDAGLAPEGPPLASSFHCGLSASPGPSVVSSPPSPRVSAPRSPVRITSICPARKGV